MKIALINAVAAVTLVVTTGRVLKGYETIMRNEQQTSITVRMMVRVLQLVFLHNGAAAVTVATGDDDSHSMKTSAMLFL